MSHWAQQYIGIPYQPGAEGPDAYYCWSFFRHVQKEHYGIDVPIIADPKTWSEAQKLMEHHEEKKRWTQVMRPSDGCAVMLARNKIPVHIGVWIIAGSMHGVLHCAQPVGVVFQNLQSLKISGWGHLTFYKHIP